MSNQPIPALASDPLFVDNLAAARPANIWRDTLGSVLRQRSAVVGLIILLFLVTVAILAPVIATHDPGRSLLGVEDGVTRRAAPCIHALGCPADEPQHLFGTDGNFRDLFSRVVYGARTSLAIGFAAIGFAIVVGTSIGALAGYLGGWIDNILMRLMDIVLAFPSLLLAIAIVTAIGSSLINALFAIGIVSVPIYARVARASVLATKETDYVTASRALGESSMGILLRRIMPNSLTPLIVQGTLGIGGAVLEIAALAFVGVAGDISNPEWGSIIGLERNQLFNAPHIILAPGLAITLTVLGFNLLGDGLRDALDPRLNR
jgi:ABC-type dipeptide/oligopeptide/nickel transport system permease subunit